MTNTEVNIDERVEIFIRALFGQVCISCAAIGVEIFMWIFGLCVFLETPQDRRRGRAVYLAISFAIIVLDCFARLPFAKYSFEVLYKPSNTTEIHELENQLLQTWYLKGTSWANAIIIWVGSGLLVYRCHIVWADRLLLSAFPILLYLASIATSIGTMVVKDDDLNSSITTSSISLTVAVECLVTLLISWRLIAMRKRQTAALASFDSKMYISVIGILVESALPLSVIGIMHIIASIYAAPPYAMHWKVAHFAFLTLWDAFTALAPQLIIFRVTIGRSWAQRSNVSSQLSDLAFRSGPFRSTAQNDDAEASVSDHERNSESPSRIIQLHPHQSISDVSEK